MEDDTRRRTWKTARVLPLWHGSSKAACAGICTSGFTYFGKPKIGSSSQTTAGATDEGFFGRGIYLTNSARYAGDIYSRGVLILAWASMREPFPVVGDALQQDMKQLKGGGHHRDYDAHYVPVHPEVTDPSCAMYYPCKPGEQPYCDEVVVFHKSQTLPRFVVELAVDAPHLMPVSSGPPESVEDLIPHVMSILANSAVEKDKKARNALSSLLAQLMQLPGDDYLDDHGFEGLYAKLQQLLTGGKVNKAVAKMLSSSSSATPEGPSSAQAAHSQASEPKPAQHKMASPKVSYATGSYETDLVQALEASLKTAPQASSPKTSAPPKATAPSAPQLPAIAFGAAQWAKYFGDVGAEPPIPPGILKALGTRCPFWPDKRVSETHLLTLIPATVDGKPFCLDLLGELIRHPKTGHATKYDYYWDKVKTQIGQQSPSQACWVLMSRDVLEGTRSKTYKNQCNVLDSKRQGQPYEPPGVLEAATAILMEHVQSGAYLFGREPVTYTLCREKIDGWQVAVGGFGGAGLGIVVCSIYCRGLAAVRKF